jgi:hypothetical protein
MSNTTTVRSLFAAAVMLFVNLPASADVAVLDHPHFGTASITRDNTSGLEWLKWTFTENVSYNDMSNLLLTDPGFEGWRFATDNEFAALCTSAGVPLQYFENSLTIPDSHIDLLASALGFTGHHPELGYSFNFSSAHTSSGNPGFHNFVGFSDNESGYYSVGGRGAAPDILR